MKDAGRLDWQAFLDSRPVAAEMLATVDIFDWRTDPIILLLPEDFFRNCAILILVLLVFWCAVLIAADLLRAAGERARRSRPPARAAPAERARETPASDFQKSCKKICNFL